jgi:hypothetical protein
MAKAKFGVSKKDTDFGRDLIAAAREALAHRQGENRTLDPRDRGYACGTCEGNSQEGCEESQGI